MRHSPRLLPALLAAVALAACGDHERTLAPRTVRAGLDGEGTSLVVEADAPIARLQVTIEDELGPREVEMKREDEKGLLAGAIDVLPGTTAKLAFRAWDAEGNLTHEGEGAVEVGKDVTPQQELALAGVPGADVAAVRVGTYRLAMTPAVIDGEPGGEYALQASLVDARGGRHPIEKGSLEWRPPEPARDVGTMTFDYGDPSEFGDLPTELRWFMERWYVGRMWICHIGDGTCGTIILRDLSPIVQVAAGWQHTCALRRSGTVRCWGSNGYGQRGTDPAGTSALTPYLFASISATANHSCGVDTAGQVLCWGSNQDGALGLPSTTYSAWVPNPVSGLPALARGVTVGYAHSCALLQNGETWCWGTNRAGQLGDGSAIAASPTYQSSTPVRVAGGVSFTTISGGQDHTCGLDARGTAWCWGDNREAQSGADSAHTDRCMALRSVPYPDWRDLACVATPRTASTTLAFAGISAGRDMTCAHTATGAGYCWGLPYFSITPPYIQWWAARTQKGMPAWRRFLGGQSMQCGIDTSDMIQCFGHNSFGQLGTGVTGGSTTTPAPIATTAVWATMDLGWHHACAVRGSLTVACWGRNDRGQLGSVTPLGYSNVPVSVTVPY